MYVIHNEQITKSLKSMFNEAQEEILLISAFGKLKAFIEITQGISPLVKKMCIFRFRLDDFLCDSSDIELFEFAKSNGWEFRINLDLHSKIYVADKKKIIIGSANTTSKGLSLVENSNIESAVYSNIKLEDYNKILKLFHQSITMTDSLYSRMFNEINLNKSLLLDSNRNEFQWSKELYDDLYQSKKYFTLDDFPRSLNVFDLCEEDYNWLNIKTADEKEKLIIKSRFMQSELYKWLLRNIDDKMYFGNLTHVLHNITWSCDKIYRRTIKDHVKCIFNWIEQLEVDDFSIIQPNYSQCIVRKNN